MAVDGLRSLQSEDWDAVKARHLLNRAGFGIPEERARRLADITPNEAVRSLVDFERIPVDVAEPRFILARLDTVDRWTAIRQMGEAERRKAGKELRREERAVIQRLKGWWLERMATTSRPLEEKLALFWHGHFATSARKVKSSYINYALNQTFRENAAGNLKKLTLLVGQSPAMLRYLDNNRNTKFKPNENWARELMELFTLGVGNYTEEDIKNSARAFTGWTLNDLRFVYNKRAHDFGQKFFFGKRGDFDGWDIVDMIFSRPETAEFICAKLWTFFAHEHPAPEIVRELARTLRESDYELKPVLLKMFLARDFYGPKALGSQVKSPAQFVIKLAYDLKLDTAPYGFMARYSALLGQDLLTPPNVKGWNGGRAWINADTLLRRYNAPGEFIRASAGAPPLPDMRDGIATGSARFAGQSKDARRSRFNKYVRSLQPSDRRALRERLQSAGSDHARRNMIRNLLAGDGSENSWDPREAFGGTERGTANKLIQHLASRYLDTALESEQQRTLAVSLARGRHLDEELELSQIPEQVLEATLHLLFSMAEYQLC
jgi:uncharacterized protein (DUF1800 family)